MFSERIDQIDNCLMQFIRPHIFIDADVGESFFGFHTDLQPKKLSDPTKSLGRVLLGGYGHSHFGHFMVLSAHRLWAVPDTEYDHILFFDKHSYNIMVGCIQRFGGDASKLIIINDGEVVRIDCLLVPERGSTDKGRYTVSDNYINKLSDQTIPSDPKLDVFVSRRNMWGMGFIAGETYLAEILVEAGFTDISPENMSYAQQYYHYTNAKRLIIVEGSAIHGLDIVGKLPNCDVIVLNRRHFSVHRLLQPKLKSVTTVPCKVISSNPDRRLSLAIMKPYKVRDCIQKTFGLDVQFDMKKFYGHEGTDAINYVIRCMLRGRLESKYVFNLAKAVNSKPHRVHLNWLARKIKQNYN